MVHAAENAARAVSFSRLHSANGKCCLEELAKTVLSSEFATFRSQSTEHKAPNGSTRTMGVAASGCRTSIWCNAFCNQTEP